MKGRRCAVTPPDEEIVGLAPPRLRSGRRMGGSARGPIASPRGVRWVECEGGVAGHVCCQLVVRLCSLTEEGPAIGEGAGARAWVCTCRYIIPRSTQPRRAPEDPGNSVG